MEEILGLREGRRDHQQQSLIRSDSSEREILVMQLSHNSTSFWTRAINGTWGLTLTRSLCFLNAYRQPYAKNIILSQKYIELMTTCRERGWKAWLFHVEVFLHSQYGSTNASYGITEIIWPGSRVLMSIKVRPPLYWPANRRV